MFTRFSVKCIGIDLALIIRSRLGRGYGSERMPMATIPYSTCALFRVGASTLRFVHLAPSAQTTCPQMYTRTAGLTPKATPNWITAENANVVSRHEFGYVVPGALSDPEGRRCSHSLEKVSQASQVSLRRGSFSKILAAVQATLCAGSAASSNASRPTWHMQSTSFNTSEEPRATDIQ